MCARAQVCWSEDSWESVLPLIVPIPEVKLRPSGLAHAPHLRPSGLAHAPHLRPSGWRTRLTMALVISLTPVLSILYMMCLFDLTWNMVLHDQKYCLGASPASEFHNLLVFPSPLSGFRCVFSGSLNSILKQLVQLLLPGAGSRLWETYHPGLRSCVCPEIHVDF